MPFITKPTCRSRIPSLPSQMPRMLYESARCDAQVVTQKSDAIGALWMPGVARTKLKVPSPVLRHKQVFSFWVIFLFFHCGCLELLLTWLKRNPEMQWIWKTFDLITDRRVRSKSDETLLNTTDNILAIFLFEMGSRGWHDVAAEVTN